MADPSIHAIYTPYVTLLTHSGLFPRRMLVHTYRHGHPLTPLLRLAEGSDEHL